MDLSILKMMPTPKKRKTIKQPPRILSNQRIGRRDRQKYTKNICFKMTIFYIEARYFEHVTPNFLLHL